MAARGLSMTFPGVRALSSVDFDVCAGEVHALIGENGAGKSTLIKILSGQLNGYEGTLLLDGTPTRFTSPRDGIASGIAVIPQELQLISTLTAAENIFLGRESDHGVFVDADGLEHQAEAALAELGERLPTGPVGRLEAGERQLVAIARALSLQARLLIMDEPTASLGAAEVARLERIVVGLALRGVAIIYVSHRLDEVERLATRITVLRDGHHIVTRAASGVGQQEMVRLMVGRAIERRALEPVAGAARECLRIEALSLPDPSRPDGYRLRDVSFAVRRGEIVGLSGLMGAGRSDLLLALVGALDSRFEGRVLIDGMPFCPSSPVQASRAGVVLLPEDRKAQGILPTMSVRSNVTISALGDVSSFGFLHASREEVGVGDLVRQTGIRMASPDAAISTLSGGNQQKALLARCLFASPSVLLLDEPTRGIDIAAKADVYDLIRSLAARGFGIVWCSSEMHEILTLCHRVVVFRDGRVTGRFDHADATEEAILTAATASSPSSPNPPMTAEPAQPPIGDGDGHPPPDGAPGGPPDKPAGGSSGSAPPGWRSRLRRSRLTSVMGLLAVTVLAIVCSPVRAGRPVFLDMGNLTDILRQVAEKGILAAGMTPVIISAGIDLSVGSVLALAATLTGLLLMTGGVGVAPTIAAVVVVGCLWGLLNGAVIARWRLPAFIATLATMSAARGVARYLSGGAAIPLGFGAGGAPESFRAISSPVVPFVPVPAVLFLLAIAAIHVLMSHMRAGRYIYAIGDNEEAARLAGVDVRRYKTLVYVLCGGLAALAGIIHCAQLEQGNPNDGVGYELDAIAAVVIGGTSLSGGIGTVGGTLIGTLIIGVINNSMGLNNIDANMQLILKGVIILAAVWMQARPK
jgi:ABC-type sugar transport system ATPase subunit/ribose/xylose/arabinose/galactoside ABC-type transport system permease subunit